MDDKGFIFTMDASLALIVVIVVTASIVTYQMLPIYQGEDHQHLEALADSALATMEQDGTLYGVAVDASRNRTAAAEERLNNRLKVLIPSGVAYNCTLKSNNLVNASGNTEGKLFATDKVTKVKVISGPAAGFIGRAWYKVENFTFVDSNQEVTTTLWNFHNWLTNFYSDGTYWNRGLYSRPYWGGNDANPQTSTNIRFSIPNNAAISNLRYLIGSCNRYNGTSYRTDTTINGITYAANANAYTFLNYRPTTNDRMYNYQGLVTTGINTGINNFYVKFRDMSSTNKDRYDMAWFSIIGKYNNTFKVPKGIISQRFNFTNAAGMAVQEAQDLDGNGQKNEFGRVYDISNGNVGSFYNLRRITWDNFRKQDNPTYQNGVPFVITNSPGTSTKCAVSICQDIYIPPAYSNVFDAYTVINPYGGVDGALVEVYNGTEWKTVFCSFDYDGKGYSDRDDGYGNIPGIVYLGDSTGLDLRPYLKSGQNNKVRVTIWDDVPGNDYDLVGLVDCYTIATFSGMNVDWENYPYNSYQDDDNSWSQTRSFTIDANRNPKGALLFVGAGLDSRHLRVEYPGGTVLYDSDTIPFYLDLAALDAAGAHKITTASSTPANYTLVDGDYNLKVTVTGPGKDWESGDWNANAELFSGTRISILYPEALTNIWKEVYEDEAQEAMNQAHAQLYKDLTGSTNPNEYPTMWNAIKTEALDRSELPNSVTVRLDLWK